MAVHTAILVCGSCQLLATSAGRPPRAAPRNRVAIATAEGISQSLPTVHDQPGWRRRATARPHGDRSVAVWAAVGGFTPPPGGADGFTFGLVAWAVGSASGVVICIHVLSDNTDGIGGTLSGITSIIIFS
jgi:hypothetical protein